MRTLSLAEARTLALGSQGLLARNPFGSGCEGTLQTLHRLGYVQIDTISVVERAHHHVLWNRVSDYESAFLEDLVSRRAAFEYWSHAAAYLPMRDFRFTLPRKRLFATGRKHWFVETPEHRRLRRRLLARIRAEGALGSRDFVRPGVRRAAGWFERTPEKQVLEQLFMEGKLMVTGRRGFEKLYDLTERVLPPDTSAAFPSPREFARHLIERGLEAHGLARADELAYLRNSALREAVSVEARRLAREGRIIELRVEGAERPFFALAEWERILRASDGAARILSPFDNSVIQRKRTRELFGFDFQIECYVPEAKRRYGYFCLPVVAGTEFLGRIDAKADRARKTLVLRSLHAAGGRKRDFLDRIEPVLREFACFNGCESVRKRPGISPAAARS